MGLFCKYYLYLPLSVLLIKQWDFITDHIKYDQLTFCFSDVCDSGKNHFQTINFRRKIATYPATNSRMPGVSIYTQS